jgi:hypothetical protein
MFRKSLLIGVVVFVLIQFVPYGRDHSNPKTLSEPRWDSETTRSLFFQACRDCHSNETVWPAYSSIAPISWLVTRDVREGRSHFNVSEWGPESEHGDDAAEMIEEDEMPLWIYRPFHPEARLSADEKESLIRGLRATFGEGTEASPGSKGHSENGGDHHDDDHHHHH